MVNWGGKKLLLQFLLNKKAVSIELSVHIVWNTTTAILKSNR